MTHIVFHAHCPVCNRRWLRYDSPYGCGGRLCPHCAGLMSIVSTISAPDAPALTLGWHPMVELADEPAGEVVEREVQRWQTGDVSDLPDEDRSPPRKWAVVWTGEHGQLWGAESLTETAQVHWIPITPADVDETMMTGISLPWHEEDLLTRLSQESAAEIFRREMLRAVAEAENDYLKQRETEEKEAARRYRDDMEALADTCADDLRRATLSQRHRIVPNITDQPLPVRFTLRDLWLAIRGK